MQATKLITGIRQLSVDYDTFILDQWGVLHFGTTAPDYVIDTLTHLKKLNKNVIILSNSSKSAQYTRDRMEKLGIEPGLYDNLLTSGEMVRQGLSSRHGAIFEHLGKNCFLIAAGKDRSTLEGLDYTVVDSCHDADFILLTNCDYKERALESYDAMLSDCAAKNLPMICANPDTIVVEGDKTYYGPGRIAERYAGMGGKVHFIGKPYKPVFAYAFSLVKDALPSRTIMIGDTMEHDIKGGESMGFATCLTMTGAHGDDFRSGDKHHVAASFEKRFGLVPSFMVEKFNW